MMEISFSLLEGTDGGSGCFVEACSTMNRFRALMERGSSIHSLKHASSQGREQINPHTEGRGFASRTIAIASPSIPIATFSI
jgi:hypothetical protein